MLTRPDGLTIWLRPSTIEYFTAANGGLICDKPAHTYLYLESGTHLCVRETPEEIERKLQQQ